MQKKRLCYIVLRELIDSMELFGPNYVQCITCEITEEERKLLCGRYGAIERKFKTGKKTRFEFPDNVFICRCDVSEHCEAE